MKVGKIKVWYAEGFGKVVPSKWVIDISDENGVEVMKLFSESEPVVEKENKEGRLIVRCPEQTPDGKIRCAMNVGHSGLHESGQTRWAPKVLEAKP